MDTKTPEGRAKIMESIITDKVMNSIINLYSRWQDEQQYEDFADYKKAMSEAVLAEAPKETLIVKAMKSPFGVVIRIPGFPYDAQIAVSRGAFGWKALSTIKVPASKG